MLFSPRKLFVWRGLRLKACHKRHREALLGHANGQPRDEVVESLRLSLRKSRRPRPPHVEMRAIARHPLQPHDEGIRQRQGKE